MDARKASLVVRWGLLLWALMAVTAAPAAAQGPTVLVTRVEGPITPVVAGHLADAVAMAEDGGHQALLVEIDTPGGLDTSMRDIVQEFLTAPVPVVVYVSPAGARAASAGAIIAFSAHVAAMAPATNIGAATPISLEGGEVIDKVINDAVAYVEAIAEARGRDVDFAVDTVRDGRSASATEAVDIGAVDLIADSREALLDELDGRTVVLDPSGERVTLDTSAASVVTFELSFTRQILQGLADPQLAFLLLSVGSLALIYELASPGGVLGGVLGAIMIVLGFFALAVLPVNLVGVLLLILAIALFIAELFAPGVGALAGGGAIALVVSGVFLFDRPTGVGLDLSFLIPVGVVAGLAAVLIGRFAWRSRYAPHVAGVVGDLAGSVGVVRLAPGGGTQVAVEGALWRASSPDRRLAPGERVRVVEMDGLELVVEPVEPQQTADGAPPPP